MNPDKPLEWPEEDAAATKRRKRHRLRIASLMADNAAFFSRDLAHYLSHQLEIPVDVAEDVAVVGARAAAVPRRGAPRSGLRTPVCVRAGPQ
jgi:hypothetical protein